MTQVGEVVGLNLSGWTFFHIDLLKKLYWQLFGLFCKTSLLCENCFGYFLAIFGKIWATFNSNIWSHWLR